MAIEIEVIKPGTFTASNGNRVTFSDQDLARCAANYSSAVFDAPIVVGHPQTDAPAYGWVDHLSFSDGVLRAIPRQVDPAFAEIVNAGRFKKVSGAFFRPEAPNNPKPGTYYLRHVGFLGAAAPAVKGLKSVSFADDGGDILSFGDEFAELAERERKVAEREAALRHTENVSFVDQLMKQGKTLPRDRDGILSFMAGMDGEVIEFAEPGSDEKRSIGRLDWFREFLSRLPTQVHFGEFSTSAGESLASGIAEFSAPNDFTVDRDGAELRRQALIYQMAHKVPFDVAVRMVAKQPRR